MESVREVVRGFVDIVDLDGAGTTTALDALCRRLAARHVSSFCTCEPTDGEIGRLIRRALRGQVPLEPCTVALLFAADRWEHVHHAPEGILSRTALGQLVVTDRYLFSSLAYQSIACGWDYVWDLNHQFPLPELVIYVDTPLYVTQRRLEGRGNRDLFDDPATQERVAAGYERAFAAPSLQGVRLARIDGSAPQETVSEAVWSAVGSLPIIDA